MQEKFIEFRSPAQILSAPPSNEGLLIGDMHIVKGATSVIGGAPGVGKSRTSMALAIAGATGKDWFGMKVHRKFKTLILQAENGPYRIFKELNEIEGILELDSHILVSNPPPYGIRLENQEFRNQFRKIQVEFQPDVIVLDPWNAAASDDKAKDYRETLDSLRSLIGNSAESPALVIIHHTRKPRENERGQGRGLSHHFSGSYVFVSVPRSAFVLEAASNDPEDDRIVWTCCKNNDGEEGGRSAWHRRNGLFAPASDFDWQSFDKPDGQSIKSSADKALEIANEGFHTRSELVSKLEVRFSLKKSAAYSAINTAFREGKLQELDDGRITTV